MTRPLLAKMNISMMVLWKRNKERNKSIYSINIMCFCLPFTDKKSQSCGKNKTVSGSDTDTQYPNMRNVRWSEAEVERNFLVEHFLKRLIYLHSLNWVSELKIKYLTLIPTCSRQRKPIPFLRLATDNYSTTDMPSKFSTMEERR